MKQTKSQPRMSVAAAINAAYAHQLVGNSQIAADELSRNGRVKTNDYAVVKRELVPGLKYLWEVGHCYAWQIRVLWLVKR